VCARVKKFSFSCAPPPPSPIVPNPAIGSPAPYMCVCVCVCVYCTHTNLYTRVGECGWARARVQPPSFCKWFLRRRWYRPVKNRLGSACLPSYNPPARVRHMQTAHVQHAHIFIYIHKLTCTHTRTGYALGRVSRRTERRDGGHYA